MKRVILLIVILCFAVLFYMTTMSSFKTTDDIHSGDNSIENSKGPVMQEIVKEKSGSGYVVLDENFDREFKLNEVASEDVFSKYKDSENKLAHIYLISESSYRKLIIDVDLLANETVPVRVGKNTRQVYYFLPEYSTVKAVTISEDQGTMEIKQIEFGDESQKNEVGGNYRFRVFKEEISENVDKATRFVVYGEFDPNEITDESEVYGEYSFKITVN